MICFVACSCGTLSACCDSMASNQAKSEGQNVVVELWTCQKWREDCGRKWEWVGLEGCQREAMWLFQEMEG